MDRAPATDPAPLDTLSTGELRAHVRGLIGSGAVAERRDGEPGVAALVTLNRPGLVTTWEHPALVLPLRDGSNFVGRSTHHSEHRFGGSYPVEGAQWFVRCDARQHRAAIADAGSTNGSLRHRGGEAVELVHPNSTEDHRPKFDELQDGDVLQTCYAALRFVWLLGP